jgi:acetyl-CoA carboxylase alpha subunit
VGEYAPMSASPDWRAALLDGATRVDVPAAARNPLAWPGYEPRQAVSVWRVPTGAVVAAWDFSTFGGSFGEDDATALVHAAQLAARERRPLLTLVRSGGTRLQEGMAALVGIPRARLALLDLAAAGVPHLSVADAPTTGGVWISVASAADLRVAVEGATVGFAGPRVVEAVTGHQPAEGSHTAASAFAAGLVDAVLPGAEVGAWLTRALAALAPGAAVAPGLRPAGTASTPAQRDHLEPGPAGRSGSEQVQVARSRTRSGADLLTALLTDPARLQGPQGDATVAAAAGRVAGRPVVAVALAAQLHGRPTPNGYRLATRAIRLAGRLGLPVLSLVDTPGAEPGTAAEDGGVAPAMGETLDALLTCPTPTLAVVHGEGGSGGALAAAAADRVLITPDAYFAAIGPEGAQAALRRPAQECADLMRVTPADLLELGAADALLVDLAEVDAHLQELAGAVGQARLADRRARWAAPLPGRL